MTPTPRIAGKRTRADLGLRRPASRSTRIDPHLGGCTLHWGGPPSTIRTHDDCERVWRSWQDFHMRTRGWVDIAYTMGFCQHGYALAGRGYGVRTAAQGTTVGNNVSYAFAHVNDTSGTPSPAAVDAATWLVADARAHGRAGTRVWPHRHWHSTDCPGDDLAALAGRLDLRLIGPPTTATTSGEDAMPTAEEIARAILETPIPTRGRDVGTDGQPLTYGWMLVRMYRVAQRLDAVRRATAGAAAVDDDEDGEG